MRLDRFLFNAELGRNLGVATAIGHTMGVDSCRP